MNKYLFSFTLFFVSFGSFADDAYYNPSWPQQTLSATNLTACKKTIPFYFPSQSINNIFDSGVGCSISYSAGGVPNPSNFPLSINKLTCLGGTSPTWGLNPATGTNQVYCVAENTLCPPRKQISTYVGLGWFPYVVGSVAIGDFVPESVSYAVFAAAKSSACVKNGAQLCGAVMLNPAYTSVFKATASTNGTAYANFSQYFVGELSGTTCTVETPSVLNTPQPPCTGDQGSVNGVTVCLPKETAAQLAERKASAIKAATSNARAAAIQANKSQALIDAAGAAAGAAASAAFGTAAATSASQVSTRASSAAAAGAAAGAAAMGGSTTAASASAGSGAAAKSSAANSVAATCTATPTLCPSSAQSTAIQNSASAAASNAYAASKASGASDSVAAAAAAAAGEAAAVATASGANADTAAVAGANAAAAADSPAKTEELKQKNPLTEYCTQNPEAAFCKTAPARNITQSCGSPPVCEGDAIDCSVATASWQQACMVKDQYDKDKVHSDFLTNLGTGNPLDADFQRANADVVNVSAFNTNGSGWSRACPLSPTFNVMGMSWAIPFEKICPTLGDMANGAIVITLIAAMLFVIGRSPK